MHKLDPSRLSVLSVKAGIVSIREDRTGRWSDRVLEVRGTGDAREAVILELVETQKQPPRTGRGKAPAPVWVEAYRAVKARPVREFIAMVHRREAGGGTLWMAT